MTHFGWAGRGGPRNRASAVRCRAFPSRPRCPQRQPFSRRGRHYCHPTTRGINSQHTTTLSSHPIYDTCWHFPAPCPSLADGLYRRAPRGDSRDSIHRVRLLLLQSSQRLSPADSAPTPSSIDCGTTSCRFYIFNQWGDVICSHQIEFEQRPYTRVSP